MPPPPDEREQSRRKKTVDGAFRYARKKGKGEGEIYARATTESAATDADGQRDVKI